MNKRPSIKNTILYSLWILPCMMPDSLKYFWIGSTKVFSALVIIGLCITILAYVRSNARISAATVWIALYLSAYVLITYGKHGNTMDALQQAAFVFAPCLLVDYWMQKDPMRGLDACAFSFGLLLLVNLVTIIMYPEGMYQVYERYIKLTQQNRWFLGYDNLFICVILPTIAIASVKSYLKTESMCAGLHFWLLLAVCYYTIFNSRPATSVVIMTLIGVYLLFSKLITKIKAFNIRTMYAMMLAFFVLIVILGRIDRFGWLIQNVLGKTMTFSNRTIIWERSLNCIAKSPLIGYGLEYSGETHLKIGYATSHNLFIWDMYSGGVVMFGMFIGLCVSVGKKIMQCKSIALSQLMAISIFCALLFWQFEAIRKGSMFMLFVIAYNIDRICQLKEPQSCEDLCCVSE